MSCNCNTANPKCEPCMICTPPGVTDLPQCTPPDPCEGQRINGDCVMYNGKEYDCIPVYSDQSIFVVMFNILEYFYPLSSEYCCGIGGGSVQYVPPTTTTTSTTTTSTTTSTTTTTTSTTTTTTTQAPYDCCIPFVSTMKGPGLYNTSINAYTAIAIPGFTIGKSIANTKTKLWAPTSTAGEIKEWNFVQTPFSATLSRTITYNSSLYNIQSLFAVNNTTLIGIDYSNPTTSRIVSLNITTTTAVVTVLFSLPVNRIATANPIYITNGKLIILNTISSSTSDTYITQYSDLTGTLDLEIIVNKNQLLGIYNCGNNIYITDSSSNIFIIDEAFPYLTFLLPSTPDLFLSVSTARECVTLDFNQPPTTSTTTTTTTTTLPPASCEVDGDCPIGFICVDGVCIPTTTTTSTTTTTTAGPSYLYYPVREWDSELCTPVGPTYIMRSTTFILDTYICAGFGLIVTRVGLPVPGPSYTYEYTGVGGNLACGSFDFICA